jgi:multiple sugar transport system permease protein
MFPILWQILTSFKSEIDIKSTTPMIFFSPTLDNFYMVQNDWNIFQFLTNSIILTILGTGSAVICGTLAAYSLTRFNIKNKRLIILEILSLKMMPPIAVIVPIYILARFLNLINTYTILILLYATFNLPLVTLVMSSFIREIPIAIEESAMIDGCSRFRAFLTTTLRLSRTGILAVSVLTAIFIWNEFLFANVLTGKETKTLPVLAAFTVGARDIAWGPAAAIGVVTIIPILLVTLYIQKYLIRGLTFGAVKG